MEQTPTPLNTQQLWPHWGRFLLGLSLVFSLFLSACAPSHGILRIRSLGQTYDAQRQQHSNGAFLGLDRLANFAQSDNLNVLFVHGIGWTQQTNDTAFGFDWIDAIAELYQVHSPQPNPRTLCQASGIPNTYANTGGVQLVQTNAPSYHSDDRLLVIKNTALGCLDRIVIPLNHSKTITVYRFFWDDTLWDAYQARHLGQDDPVPVENGQKKLTPGQEDIDALRSPVNSKLKNQLVTYGLSDAAMYLGPVGAQMREGVRGALCAAALGLQLETYAKHLVEASSLCLYGSTKKEPLAVIAHSLGSRIAFDTLHTDLHPDLARVLKTHVSNTQLEVYMLANQLPLIGLGRLGTPRSTERLHPLGLSLIAMSELDDPLTYELVPYFEHLYAQRCGSHPSEANATSTTTCTDALGKDYPQRFARLANSPQAREHLIETLGFQVTDVRLRFAPALIPGLGWWMTDPYRAHTDFMRQTSVRRAIVCGAEDGRIREHPCPQRP
jgi:hypothetical protein